MEPSQKLIRVLLAINDISIDPGLDFQHKLHRVILGITEGLGAKSGSLMLKKGRKSLEVVASTNPDIVGVRQPIDRDSPSAWVARTGERLYVDDRNSTNRFQKRYDHYRKSAFLLVPVISQGQVIGVLSVTEKIDKDRFTEEEQEILLKVAGQVIGALEAQRLADDLGKKRKTLQKRNRQLRKLEQLKTDLFRMLIHDLKGPISELMANLDILSYTANEENRSFVETAKNSCDTLYSMVSNLLDIARLEEGKLDLVYEQIVPEDLLQEAMARVHWSTALKGLSLDEQKMPFPDDQDPFWGDRGILLRVLQNLLMNGAAYSPEGESVIVGVEYPVPGAVRFFVEDQGPGVPFEHQEAVFDKFAQLEKKGDGRIYTTGLGLTFCKMAVEAHRGRIYIQSDGEHGSRFVFELPVAKGKPLPKMP